MGGYLPLELNEGKEYFSDIDESYISRFNSGRAALYVALQYLRPKRVWVPVFYCPDVIRMLEQVSIEIKYYYIDEELMPKNLNCHEGDAIIVVNYYGILDRKIFNFIINKNNIIIDNSMAFFCKPILRPGIYNVYSCRKFIGVSDGAYLIGEKFECTITKMITSYQTSSFLLKSLECGTNAAYEENRENEEHLKNNYATMSYLTRRILQNADYATIKEKRKRNFMYIHQKLNKFQKLNFSLDGEYPYCYPLYLDADIRTQLISNHIYIPTIWKECIDKELESLPEGKYSKYIHCLPVDQRYDQTDMEYMCKVIQVLMEEK